MVSTCDKAGVRITASKLAILPAVEGDDRQSRRGHCGAVRLDRGHDLGGWVRHPRPQHRDGAGETIRLLAHLVCRRLARVRRQVDTSLEQEGESRLNETFKWRRIVQQQLPVAYQFDKARVRKAHRAAVSCTIVSTGVPRLTWLSR